MSNWFNEICGTAFMPNGHCYLWEPALIWLHGVSDGLIALAYYSIPLTLLYFIRKRRDIPFPAVFAMFGAFIIACGTTHLMEVWTIWQPYYWVSGSLKLLTAAISVATAIALVRVIPAALLLPKQETLRQLNQDLDQRVRERTAELSAANAKLEAEIAQRREAEDEVRSLNTQLKLRLDEQQALFDLMPVGIAIGEDATCSRMRSNRRMAEMLGTQSKENVSLSRPEDGAPPLPFSVWQGDRRLAPNELPMQTATRTNQPVLEFEETIRREDGVNVELVVNAVPLRDEAGNARGCVATFADVTRLRTQERERLELERRILEAQRLECLGVLAGGVAHDFNNLLTAILGNASLARYDLTPTQQSTRDALLNVERASMRAAALCKELLAYAGKNRAVNQSINLSSLVAETVRPLEITISSKISLRLHTTPNLPAFVGDPAQIRQVVTSLVINASEAIGDGAGLITVTTGSALVTPDYLLEHAMKDELAPGEYVTLEVTDNGCGMSTEVMPRISDPFFTTKFTGRGLGLAAVRGILRVHQASSKVHSEVGKGTTFKLFFPVPASADA